MDNIDFLISILICFISIFWGLYILLVGLEFFMDLKWKSRFLIHRKDEKDE